MIIHGTGILTRRGGLGELSALACSNPRPCISGYAGTEYRRPRRRDVGMVLRPERSAKPGGHSARGRLLPFDGSRRVRRREALGDEGIAQERDAPQRDEQGEYHPP